MLHYAVIATSGQLSGQIRMNFICYNYSCLNSYLFTQRVEGNIKKKKTLLIGQGITDFAFLKKIIYKDLKLP